MENSADPPMSEQPFAGVTVVEFGQFVAVPYCAQLLADGGAHVIKVEPHEGDPTRHLAPLAPHETRHFVSRNRGKHCIPLDLRHPLAQKVIEALVARADVVLLNLRPGLGIELGLDFPTLSKRYPRLITGTVTGFGREGPDAGLAGMDLVVQARSGLMASGGRLSDGLPAAGDSPIADFMAAVLLSFGIASALFRREQSGNGGEVDVSLLGAAMVLQNTIFTRVAFADAANDTALRDWLAHARAEGMPFAEQMARSPGVRPSYMSSVYYRTFQTRDSAIAIACASPGLQRRFLSVTGIEDAAQGGRITDRAELARHYAALQPLAEARMAERTTAEWKRDFDAAGIPASPVLLPVELLEDEQVLANGYLHSVDHPVLGPVTMLGSPLRLDGGGFVPGHITAAFGSESRAILAEFGFSPEDIEAAVREGAVLDNP
jgi:crotonobetainyl-CoA:carnitine CoA-transferase CaiB-like acyl-CoA transferase